MKNMLPDVPEKDTGGERRLQSPLDYCGVLTLSGGLFPVISPVSAPFGQLFPDRECGRPTVK